MKLRLYNDSVRFRLDMDDVEQLKETGIITATSQFGFGANHSLTYQVTFIDLPHLNVVLDGQTLTLQVPVEMGQQWVSGSEIGIYRLLKFGDRQLNVILEKDLKCLDENSEDQSRMFPNPKS